MSLWRASWCEARPRASGAPAGASWMPLPWEQAVEKLASQLRRNADRWAGHDKDARKPYLAVLRELEHISEPSTPLLVFQLPNHTLTLVRSRG